jgi:HTH-type transcriptional regulator / antitoxin HipB
MASRETRLGYIWAEPADRMDSKSSSPHAARVAALARAVRARRKALKLTQIDLSRLAGCGPDFVYDLEAGKATLRLDKLLDVMAVLALELVVGEGKAVLRVAPELASREKR